MKNVVFIMVCCLCVISIMGCQHRQQQPTTPKEIQDTRVSVSISQGNKVSEFLLTAVCAGNPDMDWWIKADADLLDARGKFVPRPKGKAGTGWFHWKEDDESTSSHFGDYRSGNPLTETLMLDMKELAPGKYRAVPSIRIFERGKDAHPSMKDPYYSQINGIKPGKVEGTTFTIK